MADYHVTFLLCLLLEAKVSVAVSSAQPKHFFDKKKIRFLQDWHVLLPKRKKLMQAKEAVASTDDPSWDTNVSDDELLEIMTKAVLGTETVAGEPFFKWLLDTWIQIHSCPQ